MRASKTHECCPGRLARAGWPGASFVAMLSLGVAGCSPAVPPAAPPRPGAVHADHDHDHDDRKDADHDDHDHDHPETLAAAVAELETMWGDVKGALKAGDREKADDKVHAVGHLLEDFEGLLAKAKAEAQEAGKRATQEVFDCFDTLDEAFHGDEDDLKKLDLDALGQRLEAAITTLKGLATDAK